MTLLKNVTTTNLWAETSMDQEQLTARVHQQIQEIELLRWKLQQAEKLWEIEETQIKMILHDVVNSLSLVQTFSFIVSTYFDQLAHDDIVDRLTVVKDQTDHLGDLIKNLSKIVSEHDWPAIQNTNDVNVQQIAEHCLQQLVIQNPNAERITLTVSGELDGLYSNVNALYSILINLLSNSLKYSPDSSPIHLLIQGDNQGIVIRICDHGIGIAQDDVKRIFDPFYRASNALEIRGNGLGLAIVKNSVELLEGEISVESELNKGTVFTIHLPLN
jgi:signal transduction histidine kinase